VSQPQRVKQSPLRRAGGTAWTMLLQAVSNSAPLPRPGRASVPARAHPSPSLRQVRFRADIRAPGGNVLLPSLALEAGVVWGK